MMRENIFLMVLIIVAAVFCQGCGGEKADGKAASVSNISFLDLKGDEVLISLELNNNVSEMQECYLAVSISQNGVVLDEEEVYAGVLNFSYARLAYSASGLPDVIRKRIFTLMMNGSTKISITPWCARARGYAANQSGYSLARIEKGLNGSCEDLAGFRDGFICRLIKEKKIADPYTRECFDGRGLDFSFFCLAFLTEDYKICNNNAGPMLYRCLAFVMRDADFCGIEDNGIYNDICYAEMAASTLNRSLCANIKNSKLETDCNVTLAGKGDVYEEANSSG
jgi:hypothetical protein